MNGAFFNTTPSVSGGPYMFKERDAAHHSLLYVANPHWYGGQPNIDQLTVLPVTDALLVPPMLAQGQVLWAPELSRDAARDAEQQFGVRVAAYPDLGYVALQCNDRAGTPTGNALVRQALAASLDRAAAARAAMGDDATALWGDTSPQSWAYDATAAIHTARDIPQARKLLAQAGLSSTPLSLDLIYPRGDNARQAAAQSIAAQAAEAGIHITARPLDPVALQTALRSGQFVLALTETGMSLDPDDTAQLASANPSGRNYGGYASAQMDALLAAERSAIAAPGAELEKLRRPLVSAIQRLLSTDLPFIPLYAPLHHAGYNITVNGVVQGAQLDQARDGAMYARWYLAA
jgi:peptide/nickel transport system substrate-binding protein